MPLSARNLSKRYGDKWVLRDVSFDLADGEILGLFGASDSGKSTLLRVLAGQESANSGSFSGDGGYLVTEPSPSFLSIVLKRGPSEQNGRADTFEKAFSSSERLILLDEPFAGFDASSRFESIDRFRDHIKQTGKAAIVASNDFETISLISDNAAILAAGEIKQFGSAQDIYDNPNSAAVALLTGRNNVFSARRLTSTKAEIPEFVTIDGSHRLFAEKADIGRLGAINQNVALAIRPQDISISFGASFPEDNLLRAVVTRVRHLGPTTTIQFDAGGLTLEGVVFRLVGLGVGDECMLGLPPDRIRVLKD
jgi:ABC-type Fe3+/spermidine/putrescine transport system ATPase subunit